MSHPQIAPEIDLGTQELAFKRSLALTDEPIDQCFKLKLITEKHHTHALRFRWLYTLRFGVYRMTCSAFAEADSHIPRDDDEWRAAREAEFHEAAAALKDNGSYHALSNLVIHHEMPPALIEALRQSDTLTRDARRALFRRDRSLFLAREGLTRLGLLWRKKRWHEDRQAVDFS